MDKRLPIIFLVACALAACTQNIKTPLAEQQLVFSAVASHSVKNIITTTNYPLDEPFAVEAVHFPDGDDSAGGVSFMTMEPVSYSFGENLWRTEKEFFWPAKGKMVFYAASPILPQVSIDPLNGVEADWSIPDSAATQTDLCFARTIEECEMHPSIVPIVFIHALSQICFKARTQRNYSSSYTEGNYVQANIINIVLDSVKIHGIVSAGQFAQKPRKWTCDPADTVSYTVFSSKAGLPLRVDRYDNPILESIGTMLFLPQILSDDAILEEWHHVDVRTSVTDKTTGEIVSDLSYTIPKYSVISLGDYCERWIMDFKYTVRLALGLDQDACTVAVAVTDWTETKEIILGDE